jgi:putative addiction module antidote
MKLKITSIGDSAGVILPKALLARLRVETGDTIYVVETPDGIKLTPHDPQRPDKMSTAEQVMGEDRDVLRRLRKS